MLKKKINTKNWKNTQQINFKQKKLILKRMSFVGKYFWKTSLNEK